MNEKENGMKFKQGDIVELVNNSCIDGCSINATVGTQGRVNGYINDSSGVWLDIKWEKNADQMDGGYNESRFKLIDICSK